MRSACFQAARMLVGSIDVRVTTDPENLACYEVNRRAGRHRIQEDRFNDCNNYGKRESTSCACPEPAHQTSPCEITTRFGLLRDFLERQASRSGRANTSSGMETAVFMPLI